MSNLHHLHEQSWEAEMLAPWETGHIAWSPIGADVVAWRSCARHHARKLGVKVVTIACPDGRAVAMANEGYPLRLRGEPERAVWLEEAGKRAAALMDEHWRAIFDAPH